MKLKMQVQTLKFLHSLADGKTSCQLPSGKPIFRVSDASGRFPESLPEQEGVRSDGLLRLFTLISLDRRINPHSAVIIRNGRIIAMADWEPFSSNLPHVSHSLAKTVTAMAVGIAAKEKYLSIDERLEDVFGSTDKALRDVSLRHLLTMSSGAKFNDAGSLLSKNWVEDYLASDVIFEPGTDFHYNSMNSYMLSAAVCKRTGISLSEYISRRLFTPMGIGNFYWEKCPSGIEKGGWGLYMSTYDYAKLGQLWLENGLWNGVRLLPEEWVRTASLPHIYHKNLCRNGYGFQVWVGKYGTIFSGMFGQLVYVVPQKKMVIALTAGSENLFPHEGALTHIDKFLGIPQNFSSSPITHFHYSEAASLRKALSSAKFGMPLEPSNKQNVFSRLKALFSRQSVSPQSVLNEITITFNSNRAHLLPLLIQIMEGCFGQQIQKAAFYSENDRLNLQLILRDSTVTIPLSFGDSAQFIYKGYNVASQAFFTTDEDDYPVLKIHLCFTETSCTKILKFIFTEDGVTLKIRESPMLYNALDEASALIAPQISDSLRKTLENMLETDIANYKIKSFIEPTIEGKYKLSTQPSQTVDNRRKN